MCIKYILFRDEIFRFVFKIHVNIHTKIRYQFIDNVI